MTTLEILSMLQEYYSNSKPLTESQLGIYLETLDDIPADVLEQAAKHLIKTGHPFMPKVAEIRKAAGDVKKLGYVPKQYGLCDVPGAVHTWEDFDERYGDKEQWEEICQRIASDDGMRDGWTLTLAGLELDTADTGGPVGDVLVYASEAG